MAVKFRIVPDSELRVDQIDLLFAVMHRFQPLINDTAGIALYIVGGIGFATVGDDQYLCCTSAMEAGSKIAGNNHSALQFGIDDVIVHGIFIIVDMSSDIVVVAEGFCQRHDLRIGIVKLQSKPDIYRIHVDTVHINQRQ